MGPILTLGHSVLSPDDFLALLAGHGVRQLADVRTVPRSRRHPHFSQDALQRLVAGAGVAYRHFRDLGGLRSPRPDSENTALPSEPLRGYADHMATPAFAAALDALCAWAEGDRTAIMCAEADWRSCHRQLLSDALVLAGHPVEHVGHAAGGPHRASPYVRLIDGRPIYRGLV